MLTHFHHLLHLTPWPIVTYSHYIYNTDEYSRNSPCDHSRKRSVLVKTTFVKPRLNCDVNFVIKSSHVSDRSRGRARPFLGLPDWAFPLFLGSRKRPLLNFLNDRQHFLNYKFDMITCDCKLDFVYSADQAYRLIKGLTKQMAVM